MNLTIAAGPCAVESKEQIDDMASKIGKIAAIAKEYDITMMLRGGAWKPRTSFFVQNGHGPKEVVFEGTREEGLVWLTNAGRRNGLPVISEIMASEDLRHFLREMEPEVDYLQIGARNSQNFPLLYCIGGTNFGVILKNPQHGVDVKEAAGSIQRLKKTRAPVYCVRGYTFTAPEGPKSALYKRVMDEMLAEPDQYKDSRNLNNIASIHQLRENSEMQLMGVKFWYDPSHTFGGKTDEMRRKIGEYSIKALTEFGYDGIIVEVNDWSLGAKCDADQALLSTTNGIDWSKTYVKEEPVHKTFSLVDIVYFVIQHQARESCAGFNKEKLDADLARLRELRWDS